MENITNKIIAVIAVLVLVLVAAVPIMTTVINEGGTWVDSSESNTNQLYYMKEGFNYPLSGGKLYGIKDNAGSSADVIDLTPTGVNIVKASVKDWSDGGFALSDDGAIYRIEYVDPFAENPFTITKISDPTLRFATLPDQYCGYAGGGYVLTTDGLLYSIDTSGMMTKVSDTTFHSVTGWGWESGGYAIANDGHLYVIETKTTSDSQIHDVTPAGYTFSVLPVGKDRSSSKDTYVTDSSGALWYVPADATEINPLVATSIALSKEYNNRFAIDNADGHIYDLSNPLSLVDITPTEGGVPIEMTAVYGDYAVSYKLGDGGLFVCEKGTSDFIRLSGSTADWLDVGAVDYENGGYAIDKNGHVWAISKSPQSMSDIHNITPDDIHLASCPTSDFDSGGFALSYTGNKIYAIQGSMTTTDAVVDITPPNVDFSTVTDSNWIEGGYAISTDGKLYSIEKGAVIWKSVMDISPEGDVFTRVFNHTTSANGSFALASGESDAVKFTRLTDTDYISDGYSLGNYNADKPFMIISDDNLMAYYDGTVFRVVSQRDSDYIHDLQVGESFVVSKNGDWEITGTSISGHYVKAYTPTTTVSDYAVFNANKPFFVTKTNNVYIAGQMGLYGGTIADLEKIIPESMDLKVTYVEEQKKSWQVTGTDWPSAFAFAPTNYTISELQPYDPAIVEILKVIPLLVVLGLLFGVIAIAFTRSRDL